MGHHGFLRGEAKKEEETKKGAKKGPRINCTCFPGVCREQTGRKAQAPGKSTDIRKIINVLRLQHHGRVLKHYCQGLVLSLIHISSLLWDHLVLEPVELLTDSFLVRFFLATHRLLSCNENQVSCYSLLNIQVTCCCLE